MHLGLTGKFFSKEKLQFHRYKGHKESVALAFQKLNLAAIHEEGEWHIHFQYVLRLSEGGDLLVLGFSPIKWHKCLGCHIVKEKGTYMDVNLRIL